MQKGYKHSEDTKKKLREVALMRDNTKRIASLPNGENHWRWNKKASKLTLHKRIHRKYGPARKHQCECGNKANDWAFIGRGEYTDKREDYKPMCRSCHMKLDKHCEKIDRSKHKIIRDKKGRIITTVKI